MGALDQSEQPRSISRVRGRMTYQAGDSSPFIRAAELALKKQREDRMNANAELANRIRDDANRLRALEIQNKLIAEKIKIDQRMAIEADLALFWKEVVEAHKAAAKPDPTGALAAEYHRAVIMAAARHPAGTNSPQIQSMIVYHVKELDKYDTATQAAHESISKVMANPDLSYDERKNLLNSVADENPNAFKDSGVQKRFFAAQKDIETKQAQAIKAEADKAKKDKLEQLATGMEATQVVSDGVTWKKPVIEKPKPPKQPKQDSWEAYSKDLAAARKSLSIPVNKDPKKQIPLPAAIQAQFEARGTALTKSGAATWQSQPDVPVQESGPIPLEQPDEVSSDEWDSAPTPAAARPASTATPSSSSAPSSGSIRLKWVDGKLVPSS